MRAAGDTWSRRLSARVGAQVLADVSTTFAVNIYGAAAAFAAGSLLAHWLGPTLRGVFELGLFAANGGALLLGLGLNVPTTVFVANDRERGGWAFWSGVWITLGWAAVATAGAVGAGRLGWLSHYRVSGPLVVAVIAVFVGQQFAQLANGLLVGLGRIHRQNVAVAVRWTLYLGSLIGLSWALTPRAPVALVAYSLGPICASLFAWSQVPRDERPRVRSKLPPGTRRQVIWFAVRAQLANAFQFASYRFDVLLVGLWVGEAGLGVYAVGVMFSEALWLLPNAVGTVLLSHTSRFSRAESDRRIGSVFTIAFSLVIVGALLLGSLAVVITRFYLGSRYALVPAVTWLLMPGAVMLSGSKILANELVARGFPGVNTIVALGGAIITLTADVLLIPGSGILGAAIASSIGYSASFVMTLTAFRRRARGPLILRRGHEA